MLLPRPPFYIKLSGRVVSTYISTGGRVLSRKRILIENIIRRLKIFRILSERYRNRRKRFGLRFNLIATIYNLELDFNC